jgi:hypothetical protein
MKYLFIIISIFPSLSISQSADSIISHLEKNHQNIQQLACETGQLLTHRAMNLFVADRIGYYLADHENLTFTKNNVTLNTASGIFTMSHSLFEPTGSDEPVKTFNAIGLKANVFDAFRAVGNGTSFNNELGFTFKHFWLSKPQITLNNCQEKQILDAKRAIILKNLSQQIIQNEQELQKNIENLSDFEKKELQKDFYKSIKEEYSRKFAELQHRALFDSLRFKKLRIHWTNFNLYIPVMLQRFNYAQDLETDFSIKKSYPAELSISHTRFLETQNATKWYFNFRAGFNLNNSINSQLIRYSSVEAYKSLGGKKSSYLIDKELDRIIIGNVENFVSPQLKAQLVFFPPENHFGLSVSLAQNFGKFRALNGTLGIPVVLIDKQSEALSNFEIQIHYSDITNTINTGRSLKDNISIGLTWGQPIGRRVY